MPPNPKYELLPSLRCGLNVFLVLGVQQVVEENISLECDLAASILILVHNPPRLVPVVRLFVFNNCFCAPFYDFNNN